MEKDYIPGVADRTVRIWFVSIYRLNESIEVHQVLSAAIQCYG
jgi:hypothetical protein